MQTFRLPNPGRLRRLGAVLLYAAFCGSATVVAQQEWQLPERGYATFNRDTLQWRVSPQANVKRGGLLRPVDSNSEWRIRTLPTAPLADGFQLDDYEDGDWQVGKMPAKTEKGNSGTWPEKHKVLDGRVRFEVPRRTKAAILTVRHEDDVMVWLNGYEVLRASGDGKRKLSELVFDDDKLDLLERRGNLISVQVRNKNGGSYVNVELAVSPRPFKAPEQALARVERDRQEAGRLQNGLFTSWRAAAVLHETDLDAKREYVTRGPVDLRDLGAWIAQDLRRAGRGGKVSGVVPLSWKFGQIEVKGDAERPDATGKQTIIARVVGGAPNERLYDDRFYDRWVKKWVEFTFDGELRIDRWFDEGRGVLTRFETNLTGVMTKLGGDEAGRGYDLEFSERWTLRDVREPRDAQFKADVSEAIRTGAEFLRERLKNPRGRGMEPEGENANRTYNSGRLGMHLLAMIHAEIPRDDEVLVAGLDELRKRKLVDTYSLAHAIMAFEAYYTPRGEFEDLRAGIIDKPRQRRPSPADKKLIEGWCKQLLGNMDKRVDPAYLARWDYVGGNRYDHSVNQYGLLGLYAAQRCGVEISPTIWRGAVAHLVDSQQEPTEKIPLEITTHRQLATIERGSSTNTGRRPTGVGGWGYYGASAGGVPQPIYGSMTCAGLTGLTIGLAGMRDAGLTRDKALAQGERSLRRGMAWLAKNFTANWHPGPGMHANYFSHYFYYLYGVERSCELSGVALLNGRDWYQEGAVTLLEKQADNGTWSGATGGAYHAETYTAMAILFLKKSSLPVYTDR